METPSEWSKRFNSQKTDAEVSVPNAEPETNDGSPFVAEFPSEPFQCPACGQLLAPACRVCVACRKPIDFGAVGRPKEAALPAAPAPGTAPRPEPVRFSWPIFFAVLGVSCLLLIVLQGIWKEQQQILLAMAGVETLAGVWVFFDASRKGSPRPLRWALGTMFLPLVIFPWYLARTPSTPVASSVF